MKEPLLISIYLFFIAAGFFSAAFSFDTQSKKEILGAETKSEEYFYKNLLPAIETKPVTTTPSLKTLD